MSNTHTYCEETQCFLDWLEYDFFLTKGKLYIPANNSTDMKGAIALFKKLDKEVRKITVFRSEKLDIIYEKDHQGIWQAASYRT